MPPQRPKKSRLRSIALTIFLPLGAVLLGMFGVLAFLILRISLSPNVKPGDRDYPLINANPKHLIELNATIPSTLKVRFQGYYVAGNPECTYEIGNGDRAQYYAYVPIALSGNGESQPTTVALDGVLPGRCRWQFRALGYRIMFDDDAKLPEQDAVVRTGVVAGIEGKYSGAVDLWCSPRNEYRRGAINYPQCSTWFGAAIWNKNIRDLFEADDESRNAPGSNHSDNPSTTISADTTAITVHFHDIDAEYAARQQRP